jgi:hypothetical protein
MILECILYCTTLKVTHFPWFCFMQQFPGINQSHIMRDTCIGMFHYWASLFLKFTRIYGKFSLRDHGYWHVMLVMTGALLMHNDFVHNIFWGGGALSQVCLLWICCVDVTL